MSDMYPITGKTAIRLLNYCPSQAQLTKLVKDHVIVPHRSSDGTGLPTMFDRIDLEKLAVWRELHMLGFQSPAIKQILADCGEKIHTSKFLIITSYLNRPEKLAGEIVNYKKRLEVMATNTIETVIDRINGTFKGVLTINLEQNRNELRSRGA